MLVAKQFHLWLCSKENDLIQSLQRVKSQGPFMEHHAMVGWIRTHLQTSWFLKHRLKHAVAERPLLLLLDDHSSHYTLDVMKAAAEKYLVKFCWPPHTTADG